MKSFIILTILPVLSIYFSTGAYSMSDESISTADTVFINGKVVTMDEKGSICEAVAVKDGRIIYAGGNGGAEKLISKKTKIYDLEGSLLLPGFIESHGHFYGTGQSLNILDLVGTSSADEIASLVAKKTAAMPEGRWLTGRGWDQNDWKNKDFPNRSILDSAAPKNPVLLRRIDGHAVWVNSAALKLAGITRDTKNPAGGEIIKDTNGNPTGILVDNAINLISNILPPSSEDEIINDLLTAERHCFKLGITTFHDMGISSGILGITKKLYAEGKLKIRLYEMIEADLPGWEMEAAHGPQVNLYDGHLTIRGIKTFADGALGSRGALLLEPYADRGDTRGLQVTSDADLARIAEFCKKHNLQLSVHAIGDSANRKVLDVYEKVIGADKNGSLRWRIEHAQILDSADIPRFAKLGVIPSMQPIHCTSDMPWAPLRLGGKRLAGAYAWRSLLDTGAVIPGGSDTPVENANPILGIYAAITRRDNAGNPREGWQPEQRLSVIEALKMFTSWGAWAAFEEDWKGAIKPGYIADLIVIDKDILKSEPSQIQYAEVIMTFLSGELVYKISDN